MNLYDILEIDKSASQEEIRKAYLKLALKYHPDKNVGFENQFSNIKSAYDILSDPIQKQIYDEKYNSLNITDWKSFIKDVMSEMYIIFMKYVVPKNIDITIQVAFEEIYHKKVKKIDIRVKRWVCDVFTDEIISIYIQLNGYCKQYIYNELGDDSIIKNKTRSDVIISLNVVDFMKGVSIIDVFCNYDVYVVKDINLYEFFSKDKLIVDICQGAKLEIPNEGKESYLIQGMGLPYLDSDNQQKRGDVYINVNVILPQREKYSHDKDFESMLLKYFA